jgi:hypothetical protein
MHEETLLSLKPITASGALIVIQLMVANVGNEPADISASDFKLVRGNAKYAAYESPQTYGDGFIGDLFAAQRAMIRRGLYKLIRNPLDDAIIVQAWV